MSGLFVMLLRLDALMLSAGDYLNRDFQDFGVSSVERL